MIDRIKVATFVAFPWLGTIYFVVANLFGLPATQEVMMSILCVIAVVGSFLQLRPKKYDGTLDITETEDKINHMLTLESDPEEIGEKKELLFRVNPPM